MFLTWAHECSFKKKESKCRALESSAGSAGLELLQAGAKSFAVQVTFPNMKNAHDQIQYYRTNQRQDQEI